MSFNDTLAEINMFAGHSNSAIAELAQKSVHYGQAMANGQLSQEEYVSLMGDLDTLKSMCQIADEEAQVARLFQAVMLLPMLL